MHGTDAVTVTIKEGDRHLGLVATGIHPAWSAHCVVARCDWSTSPDRFAEFMTAGQHLDRLFDHLATAHNYVLAGCEATSSQRPQTGHA